MVCIRDSSLKKCAPLRRKELIHKDDIDEILYPLKESDTDYITMSGNVYKYYYDDLYFKKKSHINKHNGYIFSELFMYDEKIKRCPNYLRKDVMETYQKRQQIISKCDVMVDGKYIDSQRDISLRWRGSKNQDVINIQQSLQNGEIVLWTE